MKRVLILLVAVLLVGAGVVFGQATPAAAPAAPAASPTVKGTLDIQFDSRVRLDDAGKPQQGVVDTYKIDVCAAETVVFRGTIKATPGIFGDYTGMMKQQAMLQYAINMIVKNPANLSQELPVGRMVGGVPINAKGEYQYGEGTLRVAVDATGKASGFESAFRGVALGKPLRGATALEKIKKQAMTLTRQVQGKTIKLVVSDYDKLGFLGLVMAAGPAKNYPEVTVNGEMLYDYERSAWYFTGVTMTYSVNGKPQQDKLSGNIKWVESPDRKVNGEGKYVFDVRMNEVDKELAAGESAAFAPVDDEAAFFAVDNTIASMTGEAKYKDTLAGDTTTSSSVKIDLVGNKLSKVQTVNLTRLFWLVSVIPFNSD